MAGVASVRRARRKAGVGKCMIGWERWGETWRGWRTVGCFGSGEDDGCYGRRFAGGADDAGRGCARGAEVGN